jgi:N-acylneuraminate cytidylyltransferase/CMP-N,N'-diacetyllegionaminic acid synthase
VKPICFIPARGGSKGVPKKNLRLLSGKPLIAHTIIESINSGLFDHVIVSTDSPEIAKIAKNYGAEVPFMRPKRLAGDLTTFDDVLIHAIIKLKTLGYIFDTVVSRDCTVPFIDKHDLNGAIKLFKQKHPDSVFSVCKAHPNPYFGMFELNSKGYMFPSKIASRPITRRQDAPIVYATNGLFIHDVKKLLKTKKMFTTKMLPYEVTLEHGLMIDHEFEFKLADLLAKSKKIIS